MGKQEGPKLCRFCQQALAIRPQCFYTGCLNAMSAEEYINKLQPARWIWSAWGRSRDIAWHGRRSRDDRQALDNSDEFGLRVSDPVVDFLKVLWSAEETDVHLKNFGRLESRILLGWSFSSAVELGDITSTTAYNGRNTGLNGGDAVDMLLGLTEFPFGVVTKALMPYLEWEDSVDSRRQLRSVGKGMGSLQLWQSHWVGDLHIF